MGSRPVIAAGAPWRGLLSDAAPETKMSLTHVLAFVVVMAGIPCGLYAAALRNEGWRDER
jgi:hypothetical protein